MLWQRTLLSCDSFEEDDLTGVRRRLNLAENDKFDFFDIDKFELVFFEKEKFVLEDPDKERLVLDVSASPSLYNDSFTL